MKRIFLSTLALASVMLAACQKNAMETAVPGGAGEGVLTVNLSDDVSKTTGVTSANEKTINSAQVFVFDNSGKLECYKDGTSSSYSFDVTPGTKYVWALVNAGNTLKAAAKAVSTKSALEALTTTFTADNTSSSSFVALGYIRDNSGAETSVTVSSAASATVKVKRMVSKVTIEKITNAITSEYDAVYAGATFKIKNIYLINCAANGTFAGGAPTDFINKRKNESASTLLADAVNSTLAQNASYSTVHAFYCYPNPTNTDSSASTWSPRFTRLVVEVGLTVSGQPEKTFYYPLSLKTGIGRNKLYKITSLTIRRHGSEDPDKPVDDAISLSASIEVLDWETGDSFSYTI